jgi:hypothetical protein
MLLQTIKIYYHDHIEYITIQNPPKYAKTGKMDGKIFRLYNESTNLDYCYIWNKLEVIKI